MFWEPQKKGPRQILLAAFYCKFLWKFGREILRQGISHATTQMNNFLCNFASCVTYNFSEPRKQSILGCPWIMSQLASGCMTCVEMTFWQGFGAMYNVVTNDLVYLCHESNLILWSLSRFSTNLTVNTFLQSCMLGAITLHGSWGKVWIIMCSNLVFSLFKANSHQLVLSFWKYHFSDRYIIQ